MKDARDWTYLTAKNDALTNVNLDKYKNINYRPFDLRWTCYTGNSRGLYSSPQPKTMKHIVFGTNLGLIIGRQGQVVGNMPWNLISITKTITDFNFFYRGGGMLFPLYLYPESSGQLNLGSAETRTPNLNLEIVDQIAKGMGLTFVPEKGKEGEVCFAESGEVMPEYRQTFAPVDLLDYIYAVLHSPTYRETYKEFLKIDFPRVPYPTNAGQFWKLVALGGELRQLHLMESPTLAQFMTQYPVGGENEVEKISFVIASDAGAKQSPDETADDNFSKVSNFGKVGPLGRVYINSDQYFDSVPEVAWNFYIGGYQPAQKWLKDRKGRILDFEDIMHYQRIIKALTETDRVMREIDGVEVI